MINICFILSFYLLSSKITVNIYQFLTNDNTPIFRKILKLQKTNDFYIIGFLLYLFIRKILINLLSSCEIQDQIHSRLREVQVLQG